MNKFCANLICGFIPFSTTRKSVRDKLLKNASFSDVIKSAFGLNGNKIVVIKPNGEKIIKREINGLKIF